MKIEIKIPQMGESIVEATIGTLLKPSGSAVKENEEMIELETEKVNQPLYAPINGVVYWNVKEGDRVKVGEVIGSVDGEGQPLQPSPSPEPQREEEKKTAPSLSSSKEEPLGSGRRIMTEDFIQEIKQPQKLEPEVSFPKNANKKEESRRRMTMIRQTIAKRLVNALHSAAMLTTFNEVDMSQIMQIRQKYKGSFQEKHGSKLGLMSFFIKASVEGLKAFPNFNSYIEGEEIVTRHYYDIGVAVGIERGLVVPVVRGCDHLSFAEIEGKIADFAARARSSKLAIQDLEGGCFTITNGGVYGSMLSTPILNPPQVAILGMHKIMQRAVVVENVIVIRPMMYLALSYDHRLIDGKEAVSFLVHIKELLEDPSRFYLDI